MSLQKSIAAAIGGHNALAVALSQIARGRADCGRPIASEDARQLARGALIELGLDWSHVLKVHEEMRPAFEQLKSRRCHHRSEKMPCKICNDTGWTGWEKPMHDGRGGTRMVFIPQLCNCHAADAAAERYMQNLKAGRAGRAGEKDGRSR